MMIKQLVLKNPGVVFLCILLPACVGSISKGDPRWEVPLVSQSCNSIDGRYWAHIDGGSNDYLPFELVDRSDLKVNEFSNWLYYGKPGSKGKRIFEIKMMEDGWEGLLIDSKGVVISKLSINRIHPRVGCNSDGDLTLRSLSIVQGGEMTPGLAVATETVAKRLVDRRLKITVYVRHWWGSMNKPPDESFKKVLVFDAVP